MHSELTDHPLPTSSTRMIFLHHRARMHDRDNSCPRLKGSGDAQIGHGSLRILSLAAALGIAALIGALNV